MLEQNPFSSLFDEGLKLISYCPICNSRSQNLKINILEAKENVYLVHIKCPRCHSSILALVSTDSYHISSVGLLTDLDQDIKKFQRAKNIEADDVLTIHQLLKKDINLAEVLKN